MYFSTNSLVNTSGVASFAIAIADSDNTFILLLPLVPDLFPVTGFIRGALIKASHCAVVVSNLSYTGTPAFLFFLLTSLSFNISLGNNFFLSGFLPEKFVPLTKSYIVSMLVALP